MRKIILTNTRRILRFTALVTALSAFKLGACAQPLDEPAQNAFEVGAPQGEAQWRAVRLRNVRPGLMAWWLDPKKQPVPVEISNAHKLNAEPSASPITIPNYESLDIEGVLAIAAIDSQNQIWALAKDTTWVRFKKLVEFLDNPIRQVEIEMQVFDFDEQTLKALGWKTDKNGFFEPKIITRQEYEKTMEFLTAPGRARIINSPRVTVMNNMPAFVGSAQYTPAKLTVDTRFDSETETAPRRTQDPPAIVSYPASRFMVGKRFKNFFTPTINNDGTITLFVQIAEPLYLMRGSSNDLMQNKSADELLLDNGSKISTVVNIAPDDVVLCGFALENTETNKPKDETPPVTRYSAFFVTTKILNR